ncbi:MAG: 2'-5' RNA ligase family protein, partial [Bacteroidota bacterium]|nr:2'-5' RNA ligase family protein [Bacteroidota bacterium]
PLVLTVTLDETSQIFFNQKRVFYFPPERNFIHAHLTLFHHLPGEINICNTIQSICHQQKQIELMVKQPVSIGKGVAYQIESKVLVSLHKALQKQWIDVLTMQDRQGLWPHITVQNKVTHQQAGQTLQELKNGFVPFTTYAKGLTLWKYLNGPWEEWKQFVFAG